MLTLILGGARSGKNRHAQDQARLARQVILVAAGLPLCLKGPNP